MTLCLAPVNDHQDTLFSTQSPQKEPVKSTVTPEDIYKAYPRKVAPPYAIKCIAKACKQFAPEFLLEKTKAYAQAVVGKEREHIPHPSTWFNQHRFLDDPVEWNPQGTRFQPATAPTAAAQPAVSNIPLWKKIEILQQSIDRHPANTSSTFYRPGVTDKDKADLKDLRHKLKLLQQAQAQEALK